MSDASSDKESEAATATAAEGDEASGSPGKLLAAGRRARELTVDEVGDALNLAPQTVNWLEADDYAQLPAPAFTQGYIRNYAKYVGLDADAVVNAYQSKAGKPDVAWDSPRSSIGVAELVQRHPGMLISVVVAGVVLLIVVILAVVWPQDSTDDGGEERSDAELSAPLDTEGSEAASSTGLAGQSSEGGDRTPSGSTEGGSSAQSAPGPSGSSNSTTRFDDPTARIDRDAIDPNDPLAHLPVAQTFPVSDSQGASSASASDSPVTGAADATVTGDSDAADYPRLVSRRLTSGGSDAVRVEVNEDCWISIKDVAGKELYAILGRPGQTINLVGEGPFRVLLGYAPGASLYLNDRQILLEPYTRNSVASLVIGQ